MCPVQDTAAVDMQASGGLVPSRQSVPVASDMPALRLPRLLQQPGIQRETGHSRSSPIVDQLQICLSATDSSVLHY